MNIKSAQFVKGIVGPDESLDEDIPQIAFIGRSNVGKSSVINFLTNQGSLARTSSRPGRTQQINLFLINDSRYFLDLPGYGYAKASKETRYRLQEIIYGFLFDSAYNQERVVLIIDANIGLKETDLEIIKMLKEHEKEFVVVANKIDKIKKSECKKQLDAIRNQVGDHMIIPFSVKKRIGKEELLKEILESEETKDSE